MTDWLDGQTRRLRSLRLRRRYLYWKYRLLTALMQRIVAARPAARGPRIVIWTQTLQADLLALTHALVDSGRARVLVAVARPEALASTPIGAARPLRCNVLKAGGWASAIAIFRFAPDLVIADYLLPPYPLAPRLLFCWHGLGMWKVKPRAEIATFRKEVRPHAGDVALETPRFRAQCYGESTRRWWVEEWGISPACCRVYGMPFSDWILNPPYDARLARHALGLGCTPGPVVLLALTWHYGERLGTWGDLADVVALVADAVAARGGQVLLGLHFASNFEPRVWDRLLEVAREKGNVVVRGRGQHPDNLTDILAADVMVSNFSSFLGFFYVTGKPSIHLDPRDAEGRIAHVVTWRGGRLTKHVPAPDDVWMHSYDDNGGLLVCNPREFRDALDLALRDPECCQERSRDFLSRHVAGLDGQASSRMASDVLDWLDAAAGRR